MTIFDKRLDFIEALVVASKNKIDMDNDELDFVEFPNIPYVQELVNKININKYPKLIEYIKDIEDCGEYTNLYLYFDSSFNFDKSCPFKVFYSKNIKDFADFVKEIYNNENIKEVFTKYKDYLNNYEEQYLNIYGFDLNKVKDEYRKLFDVPNNLEINHLISFFINGGFSANKNNTVSYIKGIGNNPNTLNEKNEYIVICLYHEIAHFFINPLIDEYFKDEDVINKLYEEAIANGLPKTYNANKKTVIYEYFVRALSIILSKNKVSNIEINDTIDWFKKIGFIRIDAIINTIEDGILENKDFKSILIDYIINFNLTKTLK